MNLSRRTRRQLGVVALVGSLVSLVVNLLTGHNSGAVWSAILVVAGVWLLRRPPPPMSDEGAAPPPTWQVRVGILIFGVILGLVLVAVGSIAALLAADASGRGQAKFTLGAIGFFGLAIVSWAAFAWIAVTYRPPDTDASKTTETNQSEGPDSPDNASADRQQKPRDHL